MTSFFLEDVISLHLLSKIAKESPYIIDVRVGNLERRKMPTFVVDAILA
jgi:hypothetical protein